MKISDLLDLIEDDSVPLREREYAASERILEAVMTKIHAEKDDAPRKKGIRRGTVLAILAAALLAISATAFAAGLMDRSVHWDGTPEEEPAAVPVTEARPDASVEEAELRTMNEALAQNRGRELIIARIGGRAGCADRTEILASAERLGELTEEKRSPLLVPLSVPEGYAFAGGSAAYELDADHSYALVSSETREGGLVIERYDAPEEGYFISGYTLVFVNEAGDELTVSGRLTEKSENAVFGYADGDRVDRVDREGMDDALVIEYPEYTALFMRKALETPIPYVFPLGMIREDEEPVREFDGIVYSVTSTALEEAELLCLLAD